MSKRPGPIFYIQMFNSKIGQDLLGIINILNTVFPRGPDPFYIERTLYKIGQDLLDRQ